MPAVRLAIYRVTAKLAENRPSERVTLQAASKKQLSCFGVVREYISSFSTDLGDGLLQTNDDHGGSSGW